MSVATPPGSHTEVAVELLEAGCSVLLEKPPTTTWPTWTCSPPPKRRAQARSMWCSSTVMDRAHVAPTTLCPQARWGPRGSSSAKPCGTAPTATSCPSGAGTGPAKAAALTLGHGIHQIDLLLHLMGPWETLDARAARIARPVEFEDVSLAIVMFGSGAAGTVVTSLLSLKSSVAFGSTPPAGKLEVNHVYGYSDADWSWTPAPDATARRQSWARSGSIQNHGPKKPAAGRQRRRMGRLPLGWICPVTTRPRSISWSTTCSLASAHDTTLASTRPTMEFVTAVYASSIECETVHRRDRLRPTASTTALTVGCPLTPDHCPAGCGPVIAKDSARVPTVRL